MMSLVVFSTFIAASKMVSALGDEAAFSRYFIIPQQPLDAALLAFSETSGVEVLYETALTAGRYSAPVEGTMTPKEALARLLLGTGLVSRITVEHGLTIIPQNFPPPKSPVVKGFPEHDWEQFMPFLGGMQANIIEKLCLKSDTRPYGEQLVLRLWVDAKGMVSAVVLKDPSSNRHHNQAVVMALRGLILETSPPTEMPQPITVHIGDGGKNACVGLMTE